MKTESISVYRQSGWKRLSDGMIEIFYGADQPADLTLYTKEWDNMITEAIVKEPYVAPVPSNAPSA